MANNDRQLPMATATFWDNMAPTYPPAAGPRRTFSPMYSTAQCLLEKTRLLPTQPISSSGEKRRVLDLACGTGIVTGLLAESYGRAGGDQDGEGHLEITAADFSEKMIEILENNIAEYGWKDINVVKMDARDLTFPASHFDAVVMSFAILFIPSPLLALQSIHRVLKPGGLAGISTWNVVGWAKFIPEIVRRSKPSSKFANMYEFWQGAWDDPEFVKGQLVRAGFEEEKIGWRFVESGIKSPVEQFALTALGLDGSVFKGITEEEEWTESEREAWKKAAMEVVVEMGTTTDKEVLDIPMKAIAFWASK